MKPILCLISYVLLAVNSFAQNLYTVDLKPMPSSNIFTAGVKPTRIDKTIKAKKIPLQVAEDYLIKYTDFSYIKANDELQKKTKVSISDRIYFLIGKNDLGEIIIIPDLNHDFDFTNDKILTYNALKTKDNINSLPFIQIPITAENISSTYIIRPYPYTTAFKYNDPKEQDKYLLIESFQQQEGEIVIGDKKYKVVLHNKKPSPFFDDVNAMEIAIATSDSLKIYQYNEIISLDSINVLAADVTLDGTQLSFKQIEMSESSTGYTEGLILPQINLFDIYNKKIIVPIADKYTLIDFWGTWCLPCIALTSELKRINNTYSHKLSLVSVAYDSGINRVKKYVYSNDMRWSHIFQSDKTKEKGLVEKFNITEYPTFILIDKNGKIIARSSGAEGLKQIESVLKNN